MKTKKFKCDMGNGTELTVEKRKAGRFAFVRISGSSDGLFLGEFKLRYLKQAINTALNEINESAKSAVKNENVIKSGKYKGHQTII